ncbi:MAG: molybdopterin molybdotransferase MoeA [Gemmataceae bacterium]|nr:molybdopterin molybdotransferase MoeA [Gemmataceae bacterium]
MLDVPLALATVLRHAHPREPVRAAPAVGRVLAEDVASDVDSPPFDKALMDGYAVRTVDARPGAELRVVEEIAAGAMPSKTLTTNEAARIFTGAPIPGGADAVVMREKTSSPASDRVIVNDVPTAGQFILRRAAEMQVGEIVLPAGTVLTPQAIGVLATVGRAVVMQYPAPTVAVIATGDELVEPDSIPGPGQIRNSNGPMLLAQATAAGAATRYLGIARDTEADLAARIADGLTADILILAGGVSAGDFDLVPKVLKDLGVTPHFHHVKMKPGKPLFFGTKGHTLVFGLPGNPVSSFVGFELFVRSAIRSMAGNAMTGDGIEKMPLAESFLGNNNRPTYHPARIESNGVRGLPWFGSADLRALLDANAFLVLPPGEVNYDAGSTVDVLPII